MELTKANTISKAEISKEASEQMRKRNLSAVAVAVQKAQFERRHVLDMYAKKSENTKSKRLFEHKRSYDTLVVSKLDKESTIKKLFKSYRRTANLQARRIYAARHGIPHITVVVDCQAKGRNDTKSQVKVIRDQLVKIRFG